MNAIQRAFERAQDELSSCLDLAGQVYMFGYGVTNQFNHGPALQEHSYIAPVARYRGANEFKRCMFRSIFVFLIFIKVLSILHTSTPLFLFVFFIIDPYDLLGQKVQCLSPSTFSEKHNPLGGSSSGQGKGESKDVEPSEDPDDETALEGAKRFGYLHEERELSRVVNMWTRRTIGISKRPRRYETCSFGTLFFLIFFF